jgi:hypothetical protein
MVTIALLLIGIMGWSSYQLVIANPPTGIEKLVPKDAQLFISIDLKNMRTKSIDFLEIIKKLMNQNSKINQSIEGTNLVKYLENSGLDFNDRIVYYRKRISKSGDQALDVVLLPLADNTKFGSFMKEIQDSKEAKFKIQKGKGYNYAIDENKKSLTIAWFGKYVAIVSAEKSEDKDAGKYIGDVVNVRDAQSLNKRSNSFKKLINQSHDMLMWLDLDNPPAKKAAKIGLQNNLFSDGLIMFGDFNNGSMRFQLAANLKKEAADMAVKFLGKGVQQSLVSSMPLDPQTAMIAGVALNINALLEIPLLKTQLDNQLSIVGINAADLAEMLSGEMVIGYNGMQKNGSKSTSDLVIGFGLNNGAEKLDGILKTLEQANKVKKKTDFWMTTEENNRMYLVRKKNIFYATLSEELKNQLVKETKSKLSAQATALMTQYPFSLQIDVEKMDLFNGKQQAGKIKQTPIKTLELVINKLGAESLITMQMDTDNPNQNSFNTLVDFVIKNQTNLQSDPNKKQLED